VTAPPGALDGDVLMAAQAIEDNAAIVTTNPRHFEALSVSTFEWSGVPLTESAPYRATRRMCSASSDAIRAQ